ncbi:MAG: PKD domain-containing protein, partial [Bacteroidota bacterium]
IKTEERTSEMIKAEEKVSDKIAALDFQEEEPLELSSESDSKIEIEISGEKVSSSELSFKILNYDTDFIYRVDFGNGSGKIVGEKFSYTYEEIGSYQVKITAYGKNNKKKKFQQKIEINPFGNALNMLMKSTKNLA